MKIILSGIGYMGGSIMDEDDSGELIEFPLMDSIDISVDDKYLCSVDSTDCDDDGEINIKQIPYIKENCLVKETPPYYFRMVYGGFGWDIEFEIDDDNFDISKLELVKNESSVEELNVFIVDTIIYDGKFVHCTQQSHDDIYEYEMSDFEVIETEIL